MSEQNTELESKLFNKIPSDISEQEANLFIEQYKLYVEMMDKVSERRYKANSFFLTVHTVLITVLSGSISLTQQQINQHTWILIVSAIAGVVVCFTWWRLINSYRELNRGKFKIIHLLETRLPANLFDAEWDALNHGDGTVYKPFTHVKIYVPFVFAGLYGLLALHILGKLITSVYK